MYLYVSIAHLYCTSDHLRPQVGRGEVEAGGEGSAVVPTVPTASSLQHTHHMKGKEGVSGSM